MRIDIGFSSLSPGVLGSASSSKAGVTVDTIFNALRNDAQSSYDQTAIANLPSTNASQLYAGGALRYLSTDPSGSPNRVLDADGGVNRANLKALGVLADDGVTRDASISFNSDFTFDFDRSDGISSNAFDFFGIAAHEIGHALGFTSGVDVVDLTSDAGPSGPLDLSNFRVFNVLDLFRHSDESLLEGRGCLI